MPIVAGQAGTGLLNQFKKGRIAGHGTSRERQREREKQEAKRPLDREASQRLLQNTDDGTKMTRHTISVLERESDAD